jgi:hypothetical protein
LKNSGSWPATNKHPAKRSPALTCVHLKNRREKRKITLFQPNTTVKRDFYSLFRLLFKYSFLFS